MESKCNRVHVFLISKHKSSLMVTKTYFRVNGALEAVNKKGGVFSKMDEHLLQSVALICGLYLHNSHLQKECKILENKCQVCVLDSKFIRW